MTTLTKQGPKRRRRTRRELPYGQKSLWGATVTNFRREREAARRVYDAVAMRPLYAEADGSLVA